MPRRTSIELHQSGCRVVDVQAPKARRAPAPAGVRVTAFAVDAGTPTDPDGLAAALARLRRERRLSRQAWVTVWGLRATQQFLRLPPAAPRDLEALARREARKDIAPLESEGDAASVGLMLAGEVQVGGHRRREVSLVAASSADLLQRVQPVVDAGFEVQGVLTPALALTALARARRDAAPGVATAYVALEAHATCLAIVRDGVLLFSREIAWGHQASAAAADAVAERLVSELRRSVLFFKQTFRAAVEHVVLCGDMPDLRALTLPVGTGLGLSVETLDSLAGLDAAAVPAPADEFRASVAALRLAIAAGADPAPPVNLLPASIRATRASRTQMAQLAASLAASALLLAGAYAMADRAATAREGERQRVERELAALEPEARRRDEVRQAAALAGARQATLGAFDSQGPRLARFLEAISQAVPDEIVMTSIAADAQGLQWQATVKGIAITDEAGAGQAAVNQLLERLAASPFAGPPAQPPALRVVSGSALAAGQGASDGRMPVIPPGMSGVEFTVLFALAR
jgi:Tfp pilus assembly PilM family ATPase/Tfp pilus assembly protein PilN